MKNQYPRISCWFFQSKFGLPLKKKNVVIVKIFIRKLLKVPLKCEIGIMEALLSWMMYW